MTDLIQKLKREIALNEVVVFVGTDISVFTTDGEILSHWKGLLKHGLLRCHHSKWISDKDFQDFIDEFNKHTAQIDDYLNLANQIKDCFRRKSNMKIVDIYKSWLLEIQRKISPKKFELIQALGELGCPIITTNYDTLLETILQRHSSTWNNYSDDDKSSILHVYGHYNDTDSIIFSRNDYKRFYKNFSQQMKLRKLISGKSLLFVGYDDGLKNPYFYNLYQYIHHAKDAQTKFSIYKLININQRSNFSFLENYEEISYGKTSDDLYFFLKNLQSFSTIIRENNYFKNQKEYIEKKYFYYLLNEYGSISILGYSNEKINFDLENVYVDLKFDPTHPSIKTMKISEINEELKRKLFSSGFFNEKQRNQLLRATSENSLLNFERTSSNLMIDQYLNILLQNRQIFTEHESETIQNKIKCLKEKILKQNQLKDYKQLKIIEAYEQFPQMIILGHPGSGKTTLSKWLIINMAKQCLNQTKQIFSENKFPILIPIWKYFEKIKEKKQNLIDFICENSIFNSKDFDADERILLKSLIIEKFLEENILLILEGLDEVPNNNDRLELIKEVNLLLGKSFDFDEKSKKLIYSNYQQKQQLNSFGNHFLITSRIEGNYFENILFSIPRLTIENMSNESLNFFCQSYSKSISNSLCQSQQLFNQICLNKDLFQLAINPQLATLIISIFYQFQQNLPENRIDLYEIAIENMIEKVHFLDKSLIWSIMENIAHCLHNQVQGLSEEILRDIIRKCLIEYHLSNIDDMIDKLVDIFKYQVGLLSEFGENSFRFLHRTFQEYLAAKSLIYLFGKEKSEDEIFENILEKINIPNWRVPLSMTFGLLSHLSDENQLFNRIIQRLISSNTLLVPFVLIDSLNDIRFSSQHIQFDLIQQLADLLLEDYQNQSGFARLKQHQYLIHSYFAKLKNKYDLLLTKWFLKKFENKENLSACANIIYQLKWYNRTFHEIFLNNLHHDSKIWHWSIDSLLRFYSKENQDSPLIFKNFLSNNAKLVEYIVKHKNWLRLIVVLYGGYKTYDIQAKICEYYETAQFLNLSNYQRTPFTFYYQDIWGKDDPAYAMALHLDTDFNVKLWQEKPVFDVNEIYKDSCLTSAIVEYLTKEKSILEFQTILQKIFDDSSSSLGDRIEVLIALTILGEFDIYRDEILMKSFVNRIEQSICMLKDPIARCSSNMTPYLLSIYKDMNANSQQCNLPFRDYCRIYLSIISNSGGLPVNTTELTQTIDDDFDKIDLYAEYFSYKCTGAFSDFMSNVTTVADELKKSGNTNQIVKPFMKLNDTIQLYKPVQAYPWPTDVYTFRFIDKDDISISFLNCLENLNTNIYFLIDVIINLFIKEGYFSRNSELVPLIVLFNFGIMSNNGIRLSIYQELLPEFIEKLNRKEFLLEKIHEMCNPYYKSRAFYQLAEFYDEKSFELLNESFQLTKQISESILKFQVLEKVFSIAQYKIMENKLFSEQVVNELIMTFDSIEDDYDRVIGAIRLSFYGSGEEFKKRYLTKALETLMKMEENNEKMKLIIKIRPLICLYDDLRMTLNNIIEDLKNKSNYYFINNYYGKILSSEKIVDSSEHAEIQSLFVLYGQLNDVKVRLNQTESVDQLWINLIKDDNTEKILEIALKNEIFLTTQVAMIVDILIEKGKEDVLSVLFPYMIKPSNEVMPIVQRWFNNYDQTHPIKYLAVLLLAETKSIFPEAIDLLIDLLRSDNDQMRYRAQRVFQHPDRDVKEPSKRISVLGETTIIKIFENVLERSYLPRVQTYFRTFFFDVLWDDPEVFRKICTHVTQLNMSDVDGEYQRQLCFYNKIGFIDNHTWNYIIQLLESSPHPSFVEGVLHSTMRLALNNQITVNHWTELARILSMTNTSQFREKRYFVDTDIQIIRFILNEFYTITDVIDEIYLEIFESKLISELTIPIESFSQIGFHRIQGLCRCNFNASPDLNAVVLNLLDTNLLNNCVIENLLNYLIEKMQNFENHNRTMFELLLTECLLTAASACAQKEDYIYRKITNSSNFDKIHYSQLLEKLLNHHPYFPARGNAFILLAAMDHTDHNIILNAMNTLFDENLVKEYSMIGIPLIRLSTNEFLDDLLVSISNESAVKVHEILKIFTDFALNEKIDVNHKTKVLNYLANEIGQMKSKKLVNYYYTDLKIPFTSTLENELYKTWIKIQGLSGKTQYSINKE